MYSSLVKVLKLLDGPERRRLAALGCIATLSALFQVVGVVSILPFLALAANPGLATRYEASVRFLTSLGIEDHQGLLFVSGIGVIALMGFGNILSALTVWTTVRFCAIQSHDLSWRLLRNYLGQSAVWYLEHDSAHLTKNIITEVRALVNNFLQPLTIFLSKAITIAAILGLLFYFDAAVATFTLVAVGGPYGLIHLASREQLRRLGEVRLETGRLRFKLLREVFQGMTETKLLQREKYFLSRFQDASQEDAAVLIQQTVLQQLPRYAIETLAFGTTVGVVLYLVARTDDFSQVLPTIGLFAVAAYRLLPALQQAFSALSQLQFNVPVIYHVYGHLAETLPLPEPAAHRLELNEALELDGLTFRYPDTQDFVLRDVTLRIPARTTVGFVGSTGAGKSTLVSLLLGLYESERGQIRVDGVPVTASVVRAWQKNIGYVPQRIYVCDDTVTRNIAYGVPDHEIDMDKVISAATIARLDDFVMSQLPQGYDTIVRESGVRLSGGQCQRLGIARALYHDPQVLVFDEATSALDGITESAIMDAISGLSGTKTIILVAHRLATLVQADRIYFLEGGRVVDHGTYVDLMNHNTMFRAMAKDTSRAGGTVLGEATEAGLAVIEAREDY